MPCDDCVLARRNVAKRHRLSGLRPRDERAWRDVDLRDRWLRWIMKHLDQSFGPGDERIVRPTRLNRRKLEFIPFRYAVQQNRPIGGILEHERLPYGRWNDPLHRSSRIEREHHWQLAEVRSRLRWFQPHDD